MPGQAQHANPLEKALNSTHSQLDAGIKDIEEIIKEYKLDHVHEHLFDRMITIVLAAAGLIAAFAWDAFMKDILELIFSETATIWKHLIYAIIMTVLAAILSLNSDRVRNFFKMRKVKKVQKSKK